MSDTYPFWGFKLRILYTIGLIWSAIHNCLRLIVNSVLDILKNEANQVMALMSKI